MQIVIEDYNPEWPRLFEKEKAVLLAAVGAQAHEIIADIEHVGSTSVPGLAAKPIIDIQIGVYSLERSDPVCIPAFEMLGYEYVKAYEADTPFRRFFRKDDANGNRLHHIHLVQVDSDWHRRHLAFRDFLRAQPDLRDAYAQYKRKLAEREWESGSQYAAAKTPFIQPAEKQALAWRRNVEPAQVRIAEINPELVNCVNQLDGTIFVYSRLALHCEDGQIKFNVVPVEPYQKPYIPEEKDYAAYIGNPDQTIFFAFVEEELAGQIIIRKNWNGYAYIEDIAVDLKYRRHKIGKMLMEKAIAWAQAKGLPGVMLEAQDVNAGAARFYQHMGFRIGGFDQMLYSANPNIASEVAVYWYLRFEEVRL